MFAAGSLFARGGCAHLESRGPLPDHLVVWMGTTERDRGDGHSTGRPPDPGTGGGPAALVIKAGGE